MALLSGRPVWFGDNGNSFAKLMGASHTKGQNAGNNKKIILNKT